VLFKKVPPLCPAERELSIHHFVRDGVRDVIPRRASAKGPLGLRLGATAEGLAQKHF